MVRKVRPPECLAPLESQAWSLVCPCLYLATCGPGKYEHELESPESLLPYRIRIIPIGDIYTCWGHACGIGEEAWLHTPDVLRI